MMFFFCIYICTTIYICTSLLKPWATGGSAEQPLQVPDGRALNQPKFHPLGRIV